MNYLDQLIINKVLSIIPDFGYKDLKGLFALIILGTISIPFFDIYMKKKKINLTGKNRGDI